MMTSCGHDEKIPEEPTTPSTVKSTMIMFYPWSTNLKSYFVQNIEDFCSTIATYGLSNERVVVCIESQPGSVDIIELKDKGGRCLKDTLDSYTEPKFTTAAGLSELFSEVKVLSPSDRYSMIIGCHGMAWIPVSRTSTRALEPLHYEVEGVPLTRYFGGQSSEYQIDITTFADGLNDAGMQLEYLLFDDCYMSSVEVAYDLRNSVHYLIACPTEVMAYGYPYHKCGRYLLGEPNYERVCQEFYNFYSSYQYPYGTIAVTDCSEMDNLAAVVRNINLNAMSDNVTVGSIQVMDGYTPAIFYDFGDMIANECTDEGLLKQFNEQLDKTVIYKYHTPQYFCALQGAKDIHSYSGITSSDVSTNSRAKAKTSTAWYAATH